MSFRIRTFISIAFVTLVFTSSYSQERPNLPLKIVQLSDGSIYWPLALPVHIRLGADTVGAQSVALSVVKDQQMKATVLPMKWDGPGIHYLRHLDKSNSGSKGETAFEVRVDGRPPVSKVHLYGAASFFSTKVFFGKGLKGKFSASDDMSGVEHTFTSINKMPYAERSDSMEFTQEGEYFLTYFSVDSVGNGERVNTKTFTIDLAPPVSAHVIKGDNIDEKILSPRSMIGFNGRDDLSGMRQILFSLDTEKDKSYLMPINLKNVKDGDHVLRYHSVDQVMNVEKEISYSFYLDNLPPAVVVSITGPVAKTSGKSFISSASKITLSATDNKAGVKEIQYSINGGDPKTYSSPFTLPALQSGFLIKFRAIDNVNNKGLFLYSEDFQTFFVDDTPPELYHAIENPKLFTRDTLFITSESIIKLNSFDKKSGALAINFQIDGNEPAQYTTSFKLPAGKHMVGYSCEDKVGNLAKRDFHVVVDNIAPEVFWHFGIRSIGNSNGIPHYPAGTQLYFAATDNEVGLKKIVYSINGTMQIDYTQAIKLIQKGRNIVSVWAIDALGNKSTEKKVEFVVR